MNVHVEPDISGAAKPCLSATEPLDTGLANKLLMKIVAASDLMGDLGRLEMNNGRRDANDLLPLHLQFIHSSLDDTVGDLLDMISAEERRQEAQAAIAA